MANIHPYLTFNNTKEALDYYKDVTLRKASK